MALPDSRDLTLAPDSEFPSATGNALQDGVVREEAISRGSSLWLYDDFLGTTYTSKWASSSNAATVDDSAAGATGSVKLDANAATASLVGPILGIGTTDFTLVVRQRAATKASSAMIVGFDGTLQFTWTSASANYFTYVDGSSVDTGVAVGTTLKTLKIARAGGDAKFYIDGVLVRTASSYATTLTSRFLELNIYAFSATTDVRVDYVKLWVDR